MRIKADDFVKHFDSITLLDAELYEIENDFIRERLKFNILKNIEVSDFPNYLEELKTRGPQGVELAIVRGFDWAHSDEGNTFWSMMDRIALKNPRFTDLDENELASIINAKKRIT